MTDLAIRAVNLSKKYRIGGPQAKYRTIREAVVSAAAAPIRRAGDLLRGHTPGANGHAEIWALKDVSFDIKKGEVVGVIGANGAGKSTLLKILSRITKPTSGYADIHGRVGSLLEVGTGFHPELTGRENVYLSGAILGMRRAEIDRKFDEIVDFSGVEKFVDTPVKHFSSGMYLRLAFAVAAHLDPEILLVDEVLAVGDAAFQKKCLGKMGDVARQGRTVLFVSHNMGAIAKLCQFAMWLNMGQIAVVGPASEIIERYLNSDIASEAATKTWAADECPGDYDARLNSVCICQPSGVAQPKLDIDHPFEIQVEGVTLRPLTELSIGLRILGMDGQTIVHTAHVAIDCEMGPFRATCHFPPHLLNVGSYVVSVSADIPFVKMVFVAERVLKFSVDSVSPIMARYPITAWKGILGPGVGEWRVSHSL